MTALTAQTLTHLRSAPHRSRVFLSIQKPPTILTARVNDGSIARGATSIAFDGGSVGDYAVIQELMEVWVGSSAGKKDRGRARIKSFSSGDGVTGTVTVSGNDIVWSDNDHLTFKCDFPLRPRWPLIESDGEFKKDDDVAYTNQNENGNITPVCIAGPHQAIFMGASTGQIPIDLSSSYAMADGATMSSYSASLIYPTTGASVSVNSSGIGNVDFTSPGQYWVKFTATDSNGSSQDTYRLYIVHKDDPDDADYPTTDFEMVNTLAGNFNSGGWKVGIGFSVPTDEDDLPDETMCILWGVDEFEGTDASLPEYQPAQSQKISTLYIVGYSRRSRAETTFATDLSKASFEITTIEEVMKAHFMYSVSLEATNGAANRWFKYDSKLTNGRGVHHLWKWHSTLLEMTDVTGLTAVTDPRPYTEFEEGDLYSMADGMLRDSGTRERVISDKTGALHVIQDQQLLVDSERTALTVVHDIVPEDYVGQTTIIREFEAKVPLTHLSGIVWDGTFRDDGKPDANAICAVTGKKPKYIGASPQQIERQTLVSQTQANQLVGRYQAKENNEFPEFRIDFDGNWLSVLEFSEEAWETSLLATSNNLEVVWTDKPLYLRDVSASYDPQDGVWSVSAMFEPEADGVDGETTSCPEWPDFTGEPITIPEIDDFYDGIYTTASHNVKRPSGDSWQQLIAQASSFSAIDPHWATKSGSFFSNNSYQWRCGVGFISRSTDGGNTWASVLPSTDPPNFFDDSPAPTKTDLDYIWIEGSYVDQDTFVVMGRWQNASDVWRGWMLTTTDDGSTWNWSQIESDGWVNGTQFTDDTSTLSTSWAGHGVTGNFVIPFNSAVKLTETKIVLVWHRLTGSGTGNPSGCFAVVADLVSNDWVYGTITQLTDWDTGKSQDVIRLDDTHFAVANSQWTGSNSHDFRVAIYSVSGTTITQGTPSNVYPEGTYGNDTRSAILHRLADDEFLFATRADTSNGAHGSPVAVVETDGGVGVSSSTISAHNSSERHALQAIVPAGSGFVLFYIQLGVLIDIDGDDIASERILQAVYFVKSGSGYTFYTEKTFFNDVTGTIVDIRVVQLTSQTGFVTFVKNSVHYVAKYTQSCLTVSLGDYFELDSTAHAHNSFILLSDHSVLSYGGYSTTTFSQTIIREDQQSNEIVSTAELVTQGNIDLFTGLYALEFNDGSRWVFYMGRDLTSIFEGFYTPYGSGNVNPLSLSMSKAQGDTVYITTHELDKLVLKVYAYDQATNALTLLGFENLGSATQEELDGFEKGAYVIAAWGIDDATAVIFGRMDSPIDQSGIVHVLYTDDEGLSTTIMENGWGNAMATAAVDDFGRLFIIHYLNSASKLYDGDLFSPESGLTVISTLTVPRVNHGALWYTFYTGELVAGSAVAQARLVIIASGDLTTWKDITFDHATGSPINAIFTV